MFRRTGAFVAILGSSSIGSTAVSFAKCEIAIISNALAIDVGQPIFLASDAAAAAESSDASKQQEAVVVGVLAVVDEKPMTPTKYQVKLLQEVASMASREVQGNFDKIRRDRETHMRESVSVSVQLSLSLYAHPDAFACP